MLVVAVYDSLIVLTVVMLFKWRSLRDFWRATTVLLWYVLALVALPVSFAAYHDDRLLSEFLAALLMLVAIGGIVAVAYWPDSNQRVGQFGYRVVSWQASTTREERAQPADWVADKLVKWWQRRTKQRV